MSQGLWPRGAPESPKSAPRSFRTPWCTLWGLWGSLERDTLSDSTSNLYCNALFFQFVLQCFRCPYALEKEKYYQYSSHLYRSTPPICIAIRLRFVSQYFCKNLCGCGHRDDDPPELSKALGPNIVEEKQETTRSQGTKTEKPGSSLLFAGKKKQGNPPKKQGFSSHANP